MTTALRMTGGSAAAAAAPPPEVKAPAALYQGAVAAGVGKASKSWQDIFSLGIVSGAHIAFGAYLAITVGGACPGFAAENPGFQKIIFGAFGLPFGLIMTIITGGELVRRRLDTRLLLYYWMGDHEDIYHFIPFCISYRIFRSCHQLYLYIFIYICISSLPGIPPW